MQILLLLCCLHVHLHYQSWYWSQTCGLGLSVGFKGCGLGLDFLVSLTLMGRGLTLTWPRGRPSLDGLNTHWKMKWWTSSGKDG